MTFLKRHFWILIAGAAIVSPLVNFAYKTLVIQGYLGENAQTKYEQQVLKRSKNSGVLDTLKAARGDFFIGLEAAIEQPILGYGSWAIDKKNKVLDYYHKNDVDLDSLKMLLENLAQGKAITLPCHSWVIQGWLWWGIFGFAWMIALGLLMYRTLRYNMTVYPHLYGYFAFTLPSYFWAWLFSPFGQRTQVAVFITLALLADWQRRENKRLGYA